VVGVFFFPTTTTKKGGGVGKFKMDPILKEFKKIVMTIAVRRLGLR
jgi:hypothetical protein